MAPVSNVLRVDDPQVLAFQVGTDRLLVDEQCAGDRLARHPEPDERPRGNDAFLVGKHAADQGRSRAGVDGVVDEVEQALVGVAPLVDKTELDRELGIRTELAAALDAPPLDLHRDPLVDVEVGVPRTGRLNGRQQGFVRGAHEIAEVDQPPSGAPLEGGVDLRVTQIDLRLLDVGLAAHHSCLGRALLGRARLELLLGDRVLAEEDVGAGEVRLGQLQSRLGLRAPGLGLGQLGLVRPGLDDEQQRALRHDAAFGEIVHDGCPLDAGVHQALRVLLHAQQVARHPGTGLERLEGLGRAGELGEVGDLLPWLRPGDGHFRRFAGRRLRGPAAGQDRGQQPDYRKKSSGSWFPWHRFTLAEVAAAPTRCYSGPHLQRAPIQSAAGIVAVQAGE